MTGRDQAKLLGLLFWLLTGFQVLMIVLIGAFYVVFFGAFFAANANDKHAPPPEFMIGIVVFVMAILILSTVAFAVPKVVAGYGLRNEKSWARVWTIVACCMAVMSFPLGTAVGVYGLVFLFGDAGKAYFESPEYGRLGQKMPAAPSPNSWQ